MKLRTQSILFLIGFFLGFVAMEQIKAEDQICYAPYGEPVGEGEFDALRSLIEIHWLYGERGEEASSSWYYDEETDTSVCVIRVHRPEQILGDPDMDALGHEAMHCFIGDFHPWKD